MASRDGAATITPAVAIVPIVVAPIPSPVPAVSVAPRIAPIAALVAVGIGESGRRNQRQARRDDQRLQHCRTPRPTNDPSRTVVSEIGRATSELQSLMRNSYAVFCLKKKTNNN